MKKPQSGGITLKKHHGQYFLRDMSVVHDMVKAVTVKGANVFEIGCGDGVLTRTIIAEKPKNFWVFEIDPEWAEKVGKEFNYVKNFQMNLTNVLDVEDSIFDEHKPWTLLSNLPYHVTFPILKKVHKNRDKITDGIVMVQEEVAQKITKTSGRGYGYISLFFQHYFEWKLLTKVPPTAFYPEPKIHSRILHFITKKEVVEIPDEVGFWKYIKICFSQPRRTLRNNLAQAHFDMEKVPESYLKLRSQQMSFDQLLELWKVVK
jgi:16S rRNA (adenine1518-N6/adenine1519-N6)-dimethyltransferase